MPGRMRKKVRCTTVAWESSFARWLARAAPGAIVGHASITPGPGRGGTGEDLVEIDQDPRSGAECALSTVVDMNEGIKTVLFPVSDPAKAKAVFRVLLGEPTHD